MTRLRKIFAGLAAFVRSASAPDQMPGSTRSIASETADADNQTLSETSMMAMRQVTTAIHIRETRGDVTTLRQLHKIAGLTQPEALSAVGRLQEAGSVRIEHNLNDAFASRVALTDAARAWITQDAKGVRT